MAANGSSNRSMDQLDAVLLPTANTRQKVHRYWWTALPAIPSQKGSAPYNRLWRQFADHTMNTVRQEGNTFKVGGRGFYVEGREDHAVPAFFENFTLYPTNVWFERILERLGIRCMGSVHRIAWAYSHEETLLGERRCRIADIVFSWRDDDGDALLVIEAKKPNCARLTLDAKDYPSNGYYLKYSSMKAHGRRFQALLIDDRNKTQLPESLQNSTAVITWQELAGIQCNSARDLDRGNVQDIVLTRLSAHHLELEIGSALDPSSPSSVNFGSLDWHSEGLPQCLADWLVGSEQYFHHRNAGAKWKPAYSWLLSEPSILDYTLHKSQSTSDRQKLLWKL